MNNTINSVRLSATIPQDLVQFLDMYQQEQGLSSRSAALSLAIEALREKALEEAYKELGRAQASETYPEDNLDGLEPNL